MFAVAGNIIKTVNVELLIEEEEVEKKKPNKMKRNTLCRRHACVFLSSFVSYFLQVP